MPEAEPQFLDVNKGAARRRVAYRATAGEGPLELLWLSGFKSDMSGAKASALAEWARGKGFGCARFDYSGHGLSDGRFEDGTIGAWLEEARDVYVKVAAARDKPLILVGSSMGGYIALLLLRRLLREAPGLAARINGLVLIAPAWDMTEELLWKNMNGADREKLAINGVYELPSIYGDPIPVTRALIEEGRAHLLSRAPFDPGRPIRVLQGLRDPDVPPAHARRLADLLPGGWVEITEVPDGDHSLSRPEDLERLFVLVESLAGTKETPFR